MRSMLLKSCQRKLTQKVSIGSDDAFNNLQYTLALLKPDLFTQPHCVKAVLNEFIPRNGLKIVIQKTVSWSVKDAQYFYAEHRGKYFFQRLTDYLSRYFHMVNLLNLFLQYKIVVHSLPWCFKGLTQFPSGVSSLVLLDLTKHVFITPKLSGHILD
ncbi:Nucleoside diphosphate kinase 6 [Entomophthora muscae]|uniref:Nucleoside diphosphate kinase 6 n=1 Tax=Entomophthora muscae TaxID=34485 RepID=A0ACC2RIA0_9FUNG|nr:Nucleoside diphosphate kinase 6 [Entomophthora muscae]